MMPDVAIVSPAPQRFVRVLSFSSDYPSFLFVFFYLSLLFFFPYFSSSTALSGCSCHLLFFPFSFLQLLLSLRSFCF